MEMEENVWPVAGGVGDCKSGGELALGFFLQQENHSCQTCLFSFYLFFLKIITSWPFTNPSDWLLAIIIFI
jgi:hypothetical protein